MNAEASCRALRAATAVVLADLASHAARSRRSATGPPMTRNGYLVRLGLSMAIDLLDFTLGRVPLVGAVGEGAGTAVLVALWGRAGLLYLAELADFTEQLDGFVPTATLIALVVGWREGHLGRRKQAVEVLAPRA